MDQKTILENFKNEMLAKLVKREDRYAPLGWQTLDLLRLFMMLKEELRVLENTQLYFPTIYGDASTTDTERENRTKEMKDNAIDIANYAMFIHYLLDK